MELFGFEITRKKDELRATEVKNAKSFVPPVDDDGTPVIQQQAGYISGGAYGAYVDMEGGIKNESELIRRYRETSLVPEWDFLTTYVVPFIAAFFAIIAMFFPVSYFADLV